MKKDNGKLDKNQTKIFKRALEALRFGLFLGAGSGKTRIALCLADARMKKKKKRNTLIVSTKANILDTWPTQLREQMKVWGRTYTFHVWHDEYKQLVIPGKNCKYSARVHIVSYEHLKKLLWHYDNEFFDTMIVDESVRVKGWDSLATGRIIAFSQQVKAIYPLSGLPAPNNIQDLFAQVYMIDHGERLGENITAFRKQFMEQAKHSRFVWNLKGHKPEDRKATEQEILTAISDICVTEETEAFVKKLPTPRFHIVPFSLPKKKLKKYRKFARKAILEIEDDDAVTAVNGAVLRMKLLQYVSGNIYKELKEGEKPNAHRKVIRTNYERRDAFDAWMTDNYKRGDKLIICYAYKHSIIDINEVVRKHVARDKVFVVSGKISTVQLTKDWNAKRTDVIITFAGSIGHGLNLQKLGGRLFLYQITDNYDHFYQVVRRIYRRGNPKKFVDVFTLSCSDTADELVVENVDAKARLGKRVMSAANMIKKLKQRLEKVA